MGDMTDMHIEQMIASGMRYSTPRGISFEEKIEKWESSIRRYEKEFIWFAGNKKSYFFKNMTPLHIKNVYIMLKGLDMYIPAYIKNYVEHRQLSWLSSLEPASELKGKSVIVLDDVDCSNCPFKYFNGHDEYEDYSFLSNGDNKYHCSRTEEQIEFQIHEKLRGFQCPIKDVI